MSAQILGFPETDKLKLMAMSMCMPEVPHPVDLEHRRQWLETHPEFVARADAAELRQRIAQRRAELLEYLSLDG